MDYTQVQGQEVEWGVEWEAYSQTFGDHREISVHLKSRHKAERHFWKIAGRMIGDGEALEVIESSRGDKHMLFRVTESAS